MQRSFVPDTNLDVSGNKIAALNRSDRQADRQIDGQMERTSEKPAAAAAKKACYQKGR